MSTNRSKTLLPSQQSEKQREIVVPKRRKSLMRLHPVHEGGAIDGGNNHNNGGKISFGELPNFTSFLENGSQFSSNGRNTRASSVHTLNITNPVEDNSEDIPPSRSQQDDNTSAQARLFRRESSSKQQQYLNGNNNMYFASRSPFIQNNNNSRKSSSTIFHRKVDPNKIIQTDRDDNDLSEVVVPQSARTTTQVQASQNQQQEGEHSESNLFKQNLDSLNHNVARVQQQILQTDTNELAELLKKITHIVLEVLFALISFIRPFFASHDSTEVLAHREDSQQQHHHQPPLQPQQQQSSISMNVDTDVSISDIETPLAKKTTSWPNGVRSVWPGAPRDLEESSDISKISHSQHSFNVSSLPWESKKIELDNIREELQISGNNSNNSNDDDYGTNFMLTEEDKTPSGQVYRDDEFRDGDDEPNVELEYMRKIFNPNGMLEIQSTSRRELQKETVKHSSNSITTLFSLSEKFRSAIGLQSKEEDHRKNEEEEDELYNHSDLQILEEKQAAITQDNYRKPQDDYRELEMANESLILFEEEFKTYQSIIEEKRRRQELIQEWRLQKEQKTAVRPLNALQLQKIQQIMQSSDVNHVVKQNVSGVELRVRDFKTLSGLHWLNDNIIDAYNGLITKRSQQNPNLPSAFVFTTHFYTTLASKGYQSVQRWAKRKKIDVTALDYIFVPVNSMNTHWSLACINNKHQKFQYYDSLSTSGQDSVDRNLGILERLCEYMENEDRRVHNGTQTVEYQDYQFLPTIKSPQQQNGSDCGVFTCTAIEFLSRENFLRFAQADMQNLRSKMAFELLEEKLLD